jgi:ribose 5-phosphate isomerase RpiB
LALPVPAGRDTQAARPPAPQKVFLTAGMLQQRLAVEAGDGRVVELAPHEFLTPAAMDVADALHLAVRRKPVALPKAPAASSASPGGCTSTCETTMSALQKAAAGTSAQPAPGNPPQAAALGLVVERPSDTVRSVLSALAHDGLAVVDYSQTGCWIANTQLLCEAILAGAVAAGAVILPYAADAMVLANKTRGIRAVQGTRAASVAAALRHFAPNLLVLEHAFSTYHEMRAMIRMFAHERPARAAAKALLEAVGKLERA